MSLSRPGADPRDIEARMQALETRMAVVETRTDDLSGQNIRVEEKLDAVVEDVRDSKRGLRRVEVDVLSSRRTLARIAAHVGAGDDDEGPRTNVSGVRGAVREGREGQMEVSELRPDAHETTLTRIQRLERLTKADSRRREPQYKKWGRFAGYAVGAIMAVAVGVREVRGMVTELVNELRGTPPPPHGAP